MNLRLMLVVSSAFLATAIPSRMNAGDAPQHREREPIIGGPCEGCEAVFQGLPDSLTSVARIAPAGEPGDPLTIEGTVYDQQGRPAPGVIVYAYHTNAGGVYPLDERFPQQAAYRHGRLRGWAKTDQEGRYRFETIRPGSYPSGTIPAHVHMHVIEVGCCTYYIESIHFDDDPLVTPEERRKLDERGGRGLVHPERTSSGGWVVRRDIRLGEGVPGYQAAKRRASPLLATEPEWSRDGILVFAAGDWPDLDIYTLGPKDPAPRRVVQHDSSHYMPTWSPDGRAIAFSSTRRVRLPWRSSRCGPTALISGG